MTNFQVYAGRTGLRFNDISVDTDTEITITFYRQTNNTEILSQLARKINGAYAGMENYQPTLAIILTTVRFVSTSSKLLWSWLC